MAKHSQPDTHSLRIFGLIWAGVLTAVAMMPVLEGEKMRLWAAMLAMAFAVLSVAWPKVFCVTRIYQGWVRLGNTLGLINSRIILFLMFFVIFTPVGILFRLLRRDPLHRKPDLQAESYFIPRESQPGSMHHQF